MLFTSGSNSPALHRIALGDLSGCPAFPVLRPVQTSNLRQAKPCRRRSRQAVGSAPEGASPSAWRFLSRIVRERASSASSLRCAFLALSFRSLRPICRNRTFRRFFRTATLQPLAALHSLHLRFARPGSGEPLQGVFSNAVRDIAVRSIGLNSPFSFRRLSLQDPVENTLSTNAGCASKVSRASRIVRTYPQA